MELLHWGQEDEEAWIGTRQSSSRNNRTKHRKSASKCWIRQIIKDSLISFTIFLNNIVFYFPVFYFPLLIFLFPFVDLCLLISHRRIILFLVANLSLISHCFFLFISHCFSYLVFLFPTADCFLFHIADLSLPLSNCWHIFISYCWP